MHTIDEQLLTVLRNTNEKQLRWSDGPTAPSIAFHIWHIARYADRNQAMLASLESDAAGREIWESENLATKWGLDTSRLGGIQTGMGMSDNDSAKLTLPAKVDLLSYSEKTMRMLDERFAALDEQTLSTEMTDSNGNKTTVGAALLSHLTHASRHLGMAEALRGVQGERGTASA
jgi:hypothetical protein